MGEEIKRCMCEKNIGAITYDDEFDEFYCEECLEHHNKRLDKINGDYSEV